jgi:hypothetical protein
VHQCTAAVAGTTEKMVLLQFTRQSLRRDASMRRPQQCSTPDQHVAGFQTTEQFDDFEPSVESGNNKWILTSALHFACSKVCHHHLRPLRFEDWMQLVPKRTCNSHLHHQQIVLERQSSPLHSPLTEARNVDLVSASTI